MSVTTKLSAQPKETLDVIEPGRTVEISGIQESNPALYRKLHAMGLVSGNSLTVIGRAPFGDPISISTLGYTLSLRISEARHVSVAVVD